MNLSQLWKRSKKKKVKKDSKKVKRCIKQKLEEACLKAKELTDEATSVFSCGHEEEEVKDAGRIKERKVSEIRS